MYLIFVESNTTGTGAILAELARQKNYTPCFFVKDPTRYQFIKESDVKFVVDTKNIEELVALCNKYPLRGNISGVMSTSEYYIATSAMLADRLGLPGPDSEAVKRCRNKSFQRKHMFSNGLSSPKHSVLDTIDNIETEVNRIGLPVVVKPALGSGSCGVKKCESVAEVKTHVASLVDDNELNTERGEILIEQYVEGSEYSVELFDAKVIGITRKYIGTPPYFVEIGHDFPANLEEELEQSICSLTEKAARVFNLNWGPIHIELIVQKESIYLVEINPRLAGGMIPVLIQNSLGINLLELWMAKSTGTSVFTYKQEANKASSIRFFIPPRNGRINKINSEGINTENYEAITEVSKMLPIDYRVKGDYSDRIGYVIVSGTDQAGTIDTANKFINGITYQYENVNYA